MKRNSNLGLSYALIAVIVLTISSSACSTSAYSDKDIYLLTPKIDQSEKRIIQGEVVHVSTYLVNNSPNTLIIEDIDYSCGCLSSSPLEGTSIPSSGKKEIVLSISTATYSGKNSFSYRIKVRHAKVRTIELAGEISLDIHAKPSAYPPCLVLFPCSNHTQLLESKIALVDNWPNRYEIADVSVSDPSIKCQVELSDGDFGYVKKQLKRKAMIRIMVDYETFLSIKDKKNFVEIRFSDSELEPLVIPINENESLLPQLFPKSLTQITPAVPSLAKTITVKPYNSLTLPKVTNLPPGVTTKNLTCDGNEFRFDLVIPATESRKFECEISAEKLSLSLLLPVEIIVVK